ncbi:MAG: hypothetical protein HYX78_00880 [Armatimonadetes bacterium]|nr:hypothetical protein [Armatimonadota bacterium]
MKRSLSVLVVAAILLAAVVAYAQMTPWGDNNEPPNLPPGPHRMLPPPSPVMLADNGYLYILRGEQLVKVNCSDLSVEKVTMLPRPQPPQPPPE